MEADKVSTPTVGVRQRGDRNRMLLPASRTGSQDFPGGRGLAIEYLDKGTTRIQPCRLSLGVGLRGVQARLMLRNLSVS